MGTGNHQSGTSAFIDMAVTVLAVVSQFWDTPRSVGVMVAPHMAETRPVAADITVPTLRMRLTDRAAVRGGRPGKPVKLAASLDDVLTLELDGAAFALGLAVDELLLAALGRTVARTIGEGSVAVDVVRDARSAPATVELTCVGERRLEATEMVRLVHFALCDMLDGRPVGGGAPEVFFHYAGTAPARSASAPLLGHALEVRAYRDGGQMHIDWWFDSRRFDRATVQEFAEQFPFALIELTSEAGAVL